MLEIISAVLIGLCFLIYVFEIATDLANDKNRFVASIGLLLLSGASIYFFNITTINDELSAFLVAMFVVSGVYFFYAITTWLRKNAN